MFRRSASLPVATEAVFLLCFRLYSRLDPSRPENVAESIAVETIQTLHTLVVQFTRDLVRRAITLRELDFAQRAHTKVWRLGERVVRPPHVRRALELCGGARLSMHMHFERLVERFSEGEESEDGDDDDDVPLIVRAQMRKAKIASDEDEDEDANTIAGEHEQQQHQTSPSTDSQAHETAWERYAPSHRAIYSPFVYAPDLIKPAHPFGVYAPGTMPEQSQTAPAYPHHVTYQDNDDNDEEDDLMPSETDEEALEVELKAEERLDAADSRAAAAYEDGIWRELGSASAQNDVGTSLRRSRKRRRSGDREEVEVPISMRLRTRKRRRKARDSGGEYDEEADLEIFQSAAVIEDSDC